MNPVSVSPSPEHASTLDRSTVMAMYHGMAEWLGRQQVRDREGKNGGSVYFPTEDRYCNRDTACAAAVFMRMATLTGDPGWCDQANAARDHVLAVQGANGGFPELRGQPTVGRGGRARGPAPSVRAERGRALALLGGSHMARRWTSRHVHVPSHRSVGDRGCERAGRRGQGARSRRAMAARRPCRAAWLLVR